MVMVEVNDSPSSVVTPMNGAKALGVATDTVRPQTEKVIG